MEHDKPRSHWATLYAVVAIFSDYSRRFSCRKMVAENSRRFLRLWSLISVTKTATISLKTASHQSPFLATIVASVDETLGGIIIMADSILDSIRIRVVMPDLIRYSIRTQTADSQVPTF